MYGLIWLPLIEQNWLLDQKEGQNRISRLLVSEYSLCTLLPCASAILNLFDTMSDGRILILLYGLEIGEE